MKKREKKEDPDVLFARNTTLVLIIINAYQPIAYDVLKTAVAPKLSAEILNRCIAYLKEEKLIKPLPHKEYRATWKGINSLWSKRLRLDRDIQRMSHLAELARSGSNTTGR